MHVYTLVITKGPRRSAAARANRLLAEAVPRGTDYWGHGGRFEGKLLPAQPPGPGRIPDVELTARLPSPLPDSVIPAALVTPDGKWRWRGLDAHSEKQWPSVVNGLIDDHRGGHSISGFDCHM